MNIYKHACSRQN